MTYPIIFKRTSTGAVQQWQQEIDGSRYRTISGQVGGKLVTSEWTQCEGTNVGRANERTPEQQAVFEVEANYKKKLDKEYHETIDHIDEAKIFKPMLAKDYNDYEAKLKVSEGLWTQPKLDGMRCIAKVDGLWTRNGKPIPGCPHVMEALKPLFVEHPETILDGELYNHLYKDDFNSLMSAAKKLKPNLEDLAESKRVIQYHVYDLANLKDVRFSIRQTMLETLVALKTDKEVVKLVETDYVTTQEELDKIYGEYVEAGYEGQMVRLDADYQNKRTSDLLKRKESLSAEFILVDIQEGLGNWSGKAKRAILRHEDGREFGAGIASNEDQCAQWLKDKHLYIGKPTTVVFFNYTPDGIPRFGRVKEFNRIDNT